jgi:hypothetical protein
MWWTPTYGLSLLLAFGPLLLAFSLLVPLFGVDGALAVGVRVALLLTAVLLPAVLYRRFRYRFMRQVRNDAFRLYLTEKRGRAHAL